MAERTLNNVKIRLLIKSYSDWNDPVNSAYIPGKGEVCIVDVPVPSNSDVQEPAVLFKVGDNIHTFAQLGYSSALAADVYAWAKKADLDWEDLSDTFKNNLKSFVNTESPIYRFIDLNAGTNKRPGKWQFQKSTDGGTTWISAEQIDISNKTDHEIKGSNGIALIFNEGDGGGAKFTHSDGTLSFTGVNDGGENGISAQIYALKPELNPETNKTVNIGSRLNVYRKGMFYISETNNRLGYSTDNPDMELVVKKDIKNLSGAMHFKGVIDSKTEQQTYLEAIAAFYATLSEAPMAGDIVIFRTDGKEFICLDAGGQSVDPTWEEIGDQNIYATTAALNQEIQDRENAVEARKLEVLNVEDYGFDSNLRRNQSVAGHALVDKVLASITTDKKQVVIKMGDFNLNVISTVHDQTSTVRGFSVESLFINPSNPNDVYPSIEKGIFLYIPDNEGGHTHTFYEKEYTNAEIDDNKLDKTDLLILDCNAPSI